MPLIDVVFLLLTFFIFAQTLMVRAEVLPVELVELSTGQDARELERDRPMRAVTIAADGQLHLGREAVTWAGLGDRLRAMAGQEPRPTVFVAMERGEDGAGVVDRGPMLIRLVERIRRAGLAVNVVGAPGSSGTEGPGAGGE